MAKKKKIISPADQLKIVKLYKENNLTMKELAVAYNRSVYAIKAIIQNRESPVYHTRNLLGRNENHIKGAKNELWKNLKAATHNRYEVSNYGRIKSYAFNEEGSILKGKMHGGYLMLDYFDTEESCRKHALVHRLVALHFIGKPTKAKPNVIHIDGNKTNNRVENLQYASAIETGVHFASNEHVTKERLLRKANNTKGQKLTLTQVETIRKILANPKKQVKRSVLAARYGVSEMTIYRIQNGENWSNKGTPLNYVKKIPKILPPETVMAIKKLLKEKNISQKAIAEKFNTNETVVSRIKKGKTYKDL